VIWPHDICDAAGKSRPGAATQTAPEPTTYTPAWGWSQKTFALSQSSA
jgi:hypothetical protein